MSRRQIVPEGSTPPFGAYSHAIAYDLGESEIVFVTGQLPLGEDGKLISDDVRVQARSVFQKIVDILKASDFGVGDVVKAQIFMTDIADFDLVSSVRNEFFGEARPASTLVEVTALARPGCRVEVEVVAIRKKH